MYTNGINSTARDTLMAFSVAFHLFGVCYTVVKYSSTVEVPSLFFRVPFCCIANKSRITLKTTTWRNIIQRNVFYIFLIYQINYKITNVYKKNFCENYEVASIKLVRRCQVQLYMTSSTNQDQRSAYLENCFFTVNIAKTHISFKKISNCEWY